jgi:cyclopropane fatty-acyl-phospholipid synthase-like methyltransferase
MSLIFKLANLQPGEKFYDLGCGNGKVVIYAAKNFPIEAIGVELAFPLYLICKIRQFFLLGRILNF